MNRRNFCKTAVAAGMAAALPVSRLLAVESGSLTSDIPAVALSGADIALEKAAVEEFAGGLRGQLLTPSSGGAYEAARRVWNGMFDKHPALIARCAGAADVSRAVKFAAERKLLVAVRGGGHSMSGKSTCDGGMVIDLSPMQAVRVDPERKRVWVQPGVLGGSLDKENEHFGFITPMGTVSHTGAAGLTLGGGFGRTSPKHGLACDNLLAVDIVTADGILRRANKKEHPDLYWGVRGGGGNFGIATAFHYRTHVAGPTVLGGGVVHAIDDYADVIRFWADFQATAPRELYVGVGAFTGPDGNPVCAIDTCWCGDLQKGEKVLAPVRAFGKPLADDIKAQRYVTLQASGDEGVGHGVREYMKSGFITDVPDDLVKAIVEQRNTSPTAWFFIMPTGGAITDVGVTDTAFPVRNAIANMMTGTIAPDAAQDQAAIQSTRAYWRHLEPHTRGYYANLNEDVTEKKTRSNFGPNLERLTELKNRYDSGNMFRLNANVRPTV